MKLRVKSCLILLLCIVNHITASCQYINSITVLPSNPTSNDFVKIVTNVLTPNLGSRISQSFFIDLYQKKIELSACFVQTPLNTPEEFIDTFMIGELYSGSYEIFFTASLSNMYDSCTSSQTTSDSLSLVVGLTNISLVGISNNSFNIFQSPASTYLNIVYTTEQSSTLTFINAYGSIVKQLTLYPTFKNHIVYVDDLATGIYLVTLHEGNKISSKKIIVER